MLHKLKIQLPYLDNLLRGNKKSEVRFNDRDYQVGDVLEFWVHRGNTSERFLFRITHVHSGFGLKDGYVCLSIEEITEA